MTEQVEDAAWVAYLADTVRHTETCDSFMRALLEGSLQPLESLRLYPHACIGRLCLEVRVEEAKKILASPFFEEYARGARRKGELQVLERSEVDEVRVWNVALTMRDRRVRLDAPPIAHQPPGDSLLYQSVDAAASTAPGG